MEQEKLTSADNYSLIGSFSVLTPSQKRAIEEAEEEKRKKAAAKKAQRAEAARLHAEKENKTIRRHNIKWGLSEMLVTLFCGSCVLVGIIEKDTKFIIIAILLWIGLTFGVWCGWRGYE